MTHTADEDNGRHCFDQILQIGEFSISEYSLDKHIIWCIKHEEIRI